MLPTGLPPPFEVPAESASSSGLHVTRGTTRCFVNLEGFRARVDKQLLEGLNQGRFERVDAEPAGYSEVFSVFPDSASFGSGRSGSAEGGPFELTFSEVSPTSTEDLSPWVFRLVGVGHTSKGALGV